MIDPDTGRRNQIASLLQAAEYPVLAVPDGPAARRARTTCAGEVVLMLLSLETPSPADSSPGFLPSPHWRPTGLLCIGNLSAAGQERQTHLLPQPCPAPDLLAAIRALLPPRPQPGQQPARAREP